MVEWDVLVIGGINTDYVVRARALPGPGASMSGDTFLESPGGKGGNAAVAAARLGARTAIVGRVGNDERGHRLVRLLADENVHVAQVSLDESEPTGAAVIQVDEAGQKQILAALGANLRLSVDDIQKARSMIRPTRVLLMQLEVPLESVVAAARLAREAGVRIVLDPAPPRPLPDDLLPQIEVIRANAGEVETLTGVRVHDRASARDGARALVARGVHAVFVEAGEGNLLVWGSGERNDEQWLPELPVERVDATGAGDAFSAALSVALAEGQSLPDAGHFASATAALATTTLGAQSGLPRRHELQRYLAEIAAMRSR